MKIIKSLISMFIALLICLLSGCADKELFAPNGAVARADSTNIVLEWQASNGADFYRIYRKESGNADYKFVCDEYSTKYTDSTAKADINYSYKITAVSGNRETEGCITGETAILSKNENADVVRYTPSISSSQKWIKMRSNDEI